MRKLMILITVIGLTSCNGSAQKDANKTTDGYKFTKTDAEWKAQLTGMEYYVLRQAGTERAFTSPLNKNYEEGVYVCKGCGTPLFNSKDKFDSGTGWPSFDKEIKGNTIISSGSEYYGREEHCAVCGGHLGHVFNDGPRETTGKRHCINGVSIKFIPKNE